MVLNSLYDIITRLFLLNMLSQEPELAPGATSSGSVGPVDRRDEAGQRAMDAQDPMDSRYLYTIYL